MPKCRFLAGFRIYVAPIASDLGPKGPERDTIPGINKQESNTTARSIAHTSGITAQRVPTKFEIHVAILLAIETVRPVVFAVVLNSCSFIPEVDPRLHFK